MHKCDKCEYKSEHIEMGFRPICVCTKEHDVAKAALAYNNPKCPHAQEKKSVRLLREALTASVNGYATHIMFGGKADQHEEDWMDALEEAINAISRVTELEAQLDQLEKQKDRNG